MQKPQDEPSSGELRNESPPHVISVERIGWRIMYYEPGAPPLATGSVVDKTAAVKFAAHEAQKIAESIGEEVQLRVQDAKGRPGTTRYFEPEPQAKAEKKKGGK